MYLNPTPLAILSFPRDKYWLFASGVLELLHHESNRVTSGYASHTEEDTESLNGDDDIASPLANLASLENLNSSLDRLSLHHHHHQPSSAEGEDGTTELKTSVIDNSSKQDDDANLYKVALNDEDFYGENYFFHIAFTPIECTIICSANRIDQLFRQPLEICSQLKYDNINLLSSDFLIIQVDSDSSLDNSTRILHLTKPLAENNIPLFFISTHFNDNVVIPFDLRDKVVDILSKNKFQFSDVSNSYFSTNETGNAVATEEIISAEILEKHTFDLFRQFEIVPRIDSNTKLLLTGARAGEINSTILKFGRILSSKDLVPKYIAITRTSINEVSLILPKSSKLRSKMGFKSKNIIGSTQDVIMPIAIDFSKLPLDSTGIVSGVASKLINGLRHENLDCPFEINFLSMAQSGILMIPQEYGVVILRILQSPIQTDQVLD